MKAAILRSQRSLSDLNEVEALRKSRATYKR